MFLGFVQMDDMIWIHEHPRTGLCHFEIGVLVGLLRRHQFRVGLVQIPSYDEAGAMSQLEFG